MKYISQSQRAKLESILKTEKLSLIEKRKLRIMLLADEGKSQIEICKELKCANATASRYIQLVKEDQIDKWRNSRRGRPKKADEQILKRLKELVSSSPRNFGYPFTRWTGQWLSQHLKKEFGIDITREHINRLLKKVRPIQIKDLPKKYEDA